MSNRQFIYQITIPERMISENFVAFLQDEYFPAIHKGPTRVGQVTGLALWQSGNTFFMHVGFSGLFDAQFWPRVDDAEIQRRFDEASGARVERLGVYEKVPV